jgi:lysophospholipase L1-like esterase
MKISKEIKKKILADKNQLSINQIAKKYNIQRFEIKKIIKTSDKKTPKWFYIVAVFIPILFLIVLEIFLRIVNYGYNFDQWVSVGKSKQVLNKTIGRKYFTSGAFNPVSNQDYFDIQKKENTFRVFVLGGSSAEGFPYSPMGSFPRYIRRRLELVYPNTKIEVVNLGMTAVNSYTVLDLLPGVLDQKPDLILIYAGHNEYYGALGVGSIQSFGSSRTMIKLMLYLNEYKITQLVRNSIQWITSIFITENSASPEGTLMSRMAKDKYIIMDSKEFDAGLQQFKENLTDILQLIKNKNVPVILGRLVSNLKDQKPFISVSTPGYQTADQIYTEARDELKNNNVAKGDSLFRLAKDLDALRFRAPEKMNKIIDQLGKEFRITTIPLDSIFASESPKGIVGDNLLVDHLHPNVEGYKLMGKAFYDCMDKEGYLPKTEKAEIPLYKQDSLTRASVMFTKLDSVIGNDNITILKNNWPYVKKSKAMSEFQHKDFLDLLKPKDFIDSLALLRIENKVSWVDAHFIAATYYLRRDDFKKYFKHINLLIYQYPAFKDLDGVIRYFYEKKKLDLADYTPKRNGLMALYIGNYQNAIRHLTDAYKLNPNDPVVLYNLSLAYSKKEDYQSALKIINECLAVDPEYPEAKNLKQKIFRKIKK